MAQPLSEYQTAVVTALRADTGVQSAMVAYTPGAASPIWNIFDNVPVLQKFPYIYIGDMQGKIGSALALGGAPGKATDILLTIHIFSQYYGWKEVEGIVSAIDNVLNEKSLSLANGYTHFFALFDNYIPLVEKDGKTRHGALRYRNMFQGG